MAKKWGKRGKKPGKGEAGLEADPRNLFGVPPAPRSAPPASSTPLADYLRRGWPGVDQGYIVLPRTLAEGMPLPWQQQLTNLLAQFHDTHGRLSWPVYRVVPSRPERLVDLDEDQLAEAGYLVEIDTDGEMVYRERNGRKVDNPEDKTVLVSCLDPIVRHAQAGPAQGQATAPPRSGPVPMNIGPQPVWRTTAPPSQQAQTPQTAQPAQPSQPPQPREPQAPAPEMPVPPEPAVPSSGAEPAPAEPEPAGEAEAPPERSAQAERAAAEPRQQEPSTPPRGFQRPRGWFDELPEPEKTGDAGAAEDAEFGPTGEPTEIPYRYRR
ncbi:hypothetical protein [Qaidamihabitans albus]|uniref:hypothetical protein n=1 Tax=Qaidamihabitans albus TaxID=2795733 RepID=UPI0018F274BE|nr:hypothetical protein [Qaidamihabitans albus]